MKLAPHKRIPRQKGKRDSRKRFCTDSYVQKIENCLDIWVERNTARFKLELESMLPSNVRQAIAEAFN